MDFSFIDIKYKSSSEPSNEEEKENLYSKHMHSHYEIYISLSPDRTYIVEDKTYKLNIYDIMLIPPARYHNVTRNSTKDYKRIVVSFKPDNIDSGYLFSDFFHIASRTNSKIVRLIDTIREYIITLNETDFNFIKEGLLKQLLLLISKAEPVLDVSSKENIRIAGIMNFISENMDKKISLEMISKEMNFSPNYLEQIFKEHSGISIIAYARSKQLMYAQNLIISGSLPTEIYYKVGFKDYSTFFRAYKTYFGYSPSSNKKR